MLKRNIGLCASMLCANPGNVKQDIDDINSSGVDYMHIDIMDGHFVPNMTGGSNMGEYIRAYAHALCDFHLMVDNPTQLLEDLRLQSGERAAVHFEGNANLKENLKFIRERGAMAGIAISPGTSLDAVEPYMDMADYFLILMVNPGFKGQPMIEKTLDKAKRFKEKIMEQGRNIRILMDGAVDTENLLRVVEAGADDLVLGPYSCFNKSLGGIIPTLDIIKTALSSSGYGFCNNKDKGGTVG